MWRSLEHNWYNVRFFKHDNLCYDWGTFGWLINEQKVMLFLYIVVSLALVLNFSIKETSTQGCNYLFPPYMRISKQVRVTVADCKIRQLAVALCGQALRWNVQVKTTGYRNIIMMNSSVRGPFLPAYWPAAVPWTSIFTDRLTNNVKLVGPTISCEGVIPSAKLSLLLHNC